MISLEILHYRRRTAHSKKAGSAQKKPRIASAIAAVSSSVKEEIRSPVQKAFRHHYDSNGTDEIIKDLASFHLTSNFTDQDWKKLFIACDPLQKGLILDAGRAEVLKAAARFPKDRWGFFQKAAGHFDIENWCVRTRLDLLDILSSIDSDDDSIFLEMKGLSQGLNSEDALLILKNLIEVPLNEREEIVEIVRAKIDPAMSAQERVNLLQLAEADNWRSPLISPNITSEERLQLKKAVEAISGKRAANTPARIDWIAYALISPQMSTEDKIAIVHAIGSHLSKFNNALQLHQFICTVQTFITFDMDAQNRAEMIHILANIEADQIEKVIHIFHILIENAMTAQERLSILSAIASLSQEVRAGLHLIAFRLFKPEMNAEDRVSILKAFSEFPPEIRKSFFQFTQVFESPNAQDVCQMLQSVSLAGIEIERLLIASRLIVQEMSVQDRMTLLGSIPPFPSAQEQQFIKDHVQSKIQDDMEIAERVLTLSAICLVCSALKNHPAFDDWLIPFLIDEVFMQLQINPSDLDINGLIELLAAEEMLIDIGQLKENPLLSLEQAFELFDAKKTFPKIQYETDAEVDPVGTDLGGITRDFVTNLIQALFYPTPPEPRPISIKETERGFVPMAEEPHFYERLGMLFAASLNRYPTQVMKLPLGKHFHPVLFDMLHALTQSEMLQIPTHFANLEDVPEPIRNKLLKLYLIDEMPSAFGALNMPKEALTAAVDAFVEQGAVNEWMESAGITTQEEFLIERGLNQILLAVLSLAKSMYERMKTPARWDAIKEASSAILRLKIEGDLSKETVKLAFEHLETDDPRKEWLLQWIDEASPQRLADFVYSISGATALLPHQKFDINLQAPSSKLPSFHTCFYTIDIPEYDSYETFRVKLEASLEYIKGGNGVGLA